MVAATHSEEETLAWAAAFAKALAPGASVALSGDLGAGKTVVSKGICRALGYAGPVKSPSYALVHEYPNGPGKPPIFHLDLYRLSPGARLEELADLEAMERGVALVEWPERLAEGDFEFTHHITIKKAGENEREIEWKIGAGA